MAGKAVNFNTHCNLYDSHLESAAKWLSCNGEVWGVGPTAVFASAAALFLYNELEATLHIAGDHAQVSMLEKTMISSMVVGMLALMIHMWVCAMRFFQYYLDTLIKDSPNVLLEMTTAGLLGGQSEIVPLGPLTRFLRQQQPQIHITVCWFLSLCYADYVRKHYCQRFNMPYLEQWQAELHERAVRGVQRTMERVNSFVGSIHHRLRGYARPAAQTNESDGLSSKSSPLDVSHACSRVSWGKGSGAATPAGHISQKELCVRLVGQSSETTADAIEKLRNYISLVEWAQCWDSSVSVIPTALWAAGAAALAHRLVAALFTRFLFRRVPLWEIMIQHLLYIWMVIYSLQFWTVLVKIVKVMVEYCYDEGDPTEEDVESCKIMQQWAIWMCGMAPLAIYIHTRPRPEAPPLMIWITTSPWQRREMGPYGYYLNRPLSTLQSSANLAIRQQALSVRRAFSDSKIIVKEPPKKKRYSKSV